MRIQAGCFHTNNLSPICYILEASTSRVNPPKKPKTKKSVISYNNVSIYQNVDALGQVAIESPLEGTAYLIWRKQLNRRIIWFDFMFLFSR